MPYTKRRRHCTHQPSSGHRFVRVAKTKKRSHTTTRKQQWRKRLGRTKHTQKMRIRKGGSVFSAFSSVSAANQRVAEKLRTIHWTGGGIQSFDALESDIFFIEQSVEKLKELSTSDLLSGNQQKELLDVITWTISQTPTDAQTDEAAGSANAQTDEAAGSANAQTDEAADGADAQQDKAAGGAATQAAGAGVQAGTADQKKVMFFVVLNTEEKKISVFIPVVIQESPTGTGPLKLAVFPGGSSTTYDSPTSDTLEKYLESNPDTNGVFKKKKILNAVQSTVCETDSFTDADVWRNAELSTYTRLFNLNRKYFQDKDKQNRTFDWEKNNTAVNGILEDLKSKLDVILQDAEKCVEGSIDSVGDGVVGQEEKSIEAEVINTCDNIMNKCKSFTPHQKQIYISRVQKLFNNCPPVKRWLQINSPKLYSFRFQGQQAFRYIFSVELTEYTLDTQHACVLSKCPKNKFEKSYETLTKVSRIINLIIKNLIKEGCTLYKISKQLNDEEQAEQNSATSAPGLVAKVASQQMKKTAYSIGTKLSSTLSSTMGWANNNNNGSGNNVSSDKVDNERSSKKNNDNTGFSCAIM